MNRQRVRREAPQPARQVGKTQNPAPLPSSGARTAREEECDTGLFGSPHSPSIQTSSTRERTFKPAKSRAGELPSAERLISIVSERALEELRVKYDVDRRGRTPEELLEALIKSGVEEWNSWRERYPGVQVSLRGAQLNGRDLRGANLSGVDLRGANLKGALLENANLESANLEKANLNRATARRADFNGATLDGAKMKEADLSNTTMINAHLVKTDLSETTMRGTDLSESTQRKVNLSEADLTGATMTGANLRSANMTDATLTGATIDTANLIGAKLEKARLIRANLSGSSLKEAVLTGADLRHATLNDTQLNGADLTNANLSNANVMKADFSDALLYNSDLTQTIHKKTKLNRADLTGATLTEVNLKGSLLENAIFDRATLTRVNLESAHLVYAHFDHATFAQVRFHKADCTRAKFIGCDLIGADLSEVKFIEALLSDVILQQATFEGAHMGRTELLNVNLSEANGLDTVIHDESSIIDIETLARSRKNISISFLRKAGLQAEIVDAIDPLVNPSIAYRSCFISYSSKDTQFVEQLSRQLKFLGVQCWYAPESLKSGDRFPVEISESIHHYDKVLLVLSQYSADSLWVGKEVSIATDRERQDQQAVLFPIRLDDIVQTSKQEWVKDIHRQRHIGDFTNWEKADVYLLSLARLLRGLRVEP